ncbi:MAG: DUF3488 and transglutaminase-like domain-containing protein [Gammaproteobacteria bacterium]
MKADELSVREVSWLAAALVGGLVPHMQRIPVLLSVGFVGVVLWRVLGAYGRLPLPDRAHRLLWISKQIVAVAAFISVYIAYRGQLGRDAGVELLAALLGLKLLEMRSPRDYYLVAFLCYFLVVTNFFYSQTMATAMYMLALVLFVTTVLIQFNTPSAYRHSGSMAGLALRMTVQAVPLMLVAFILFPRLPGPLWGLPQDAFDGVSGLSDELTLGEVARLGLSDEIAFRVEFSGSQPRARDLYWRGPVLWQTDGITWRAGRMGNEPAGAIERLGPSYAYRVTLEPHRERWLLGLDRVTRTEGAIRITADGRLLTTNPVRRRKIYDLESVVDYRDRDLSAAERRAALALPSDWHPRARALAATWAEGGVAATTIAERALAFYRESNFYYSLTPPPPGTDSIDGFLFDTQEGFCEHFAASFVVLMRAAGVPARVVTGYQGGEFNSLADYLIIRQRDAHAWAEIYGEEDGWVRFDPTGAVAPARVSLGIDTVLPRRSTLPGLDREGMGGLLLSRFRDGIDALSYSWNQWVLGYSAQAQRRLLEDLGFEDVDYGALVIALTLALALVTAVLAGLLLRNPRARVDAAQQAWQLLSARLARVGLARQASEAPQAYAARVALARADLAAEMIAITHLYTMLRYGPGSADPGPLLRRVRRFRPRRR